VGQKYQIMAYSDFTSLDLIQKFGIKFNAEHLFPNVSPIEPSDWLKESLVRGQDSGFGSEKSRSERLVSPVLLELSTNHSHDFSIYSGSIWM